MSRLIVAAGLLLLLLVAGVGAQVPALPQVKPGEVPDREGFSFCRLQYRSVRQEALGSGWTTDYPAADRNLMIRIAELTNVPVTRGHLGEPAHAIVRASDKNLYQCPFLFASDVGTINFLDAELEGLRSYLLKGGFLWVDDFWGPKALEQWQIEIARVLPNHQAVELPLDHPIFKTFYNVKKVPQIPAISFWLSTNGLTAERGGVSREPKIYGIHDEGGRLMVLMSHNTDIADGWEREGENADFFATFSGPGYAVGVNVVIWAMTH